MLLRTKLVASSIAAVVLAATATLLVAGPLNPPAGSVASTYKTLTEVEPRIAINATNTPGNATAEYIISTPGSYYLTGNITPGNGKSAIKIAASNVTLDLNGFLVTAGAGSLAGITTESIPQANITITNGEVNNFASGGVMLSECYQSRVANIRITAGGVGILVSRGGIVSDCTVRAANGNAFVAYENVHFVRCIADAGKANGFVVSNSFCSYESCSAANNTGDGFSVNNSIMTGCNADANNGNGYVSGYAGRFTNCRAGYNTKSGFVSTSLASFEDCTAVQNQQIGINAGDNATIRKCTVSSNALQGIQANSRCTITDNQVCFNGSAGNFPGIHCISNYNTVEGNMCSGNTFGVYVSTSNNLIIRNICSANSNLNYYIVSGNRVGTINTGSPTVGLAAGNSGGGLGFTDPNTNFAY
ncbi:MAG: hypothetical protein IT432_16700 [Phycisphaerales bacterium]|nr:hypothetical protein [Phycisphaerales bacterium]